MPLVASRILITGASSGIGRALARRLLRTGMELALIARRAELLEELSAEAPGRCLVLACDLRDRAAHDRTMARLLARWPRLDGLVLNAGESVLSPLDEPKAEIFDRLLELNLVAPLRTVRTLLPHLEDGGRIVAVGSVLGRFGIPSGHGYCASKAGLAGLCRALALDLASRRISVNCLQPGWVDTPMAERAIALQSAPMGMSAGEARTFFMNEVPLRRFLDPDEVAAWIEWLLSPPAGGMTGQALNLCAGVLA
jgi:NAD(P)-dependent dehydrogenase (short-subunit alcohol dehydrogenase family)